MAAEDPTPATYMARLDTLLDRLVTSAASRRTTPRPKAIPSRVFKIGENWPNFSEHFVQCVKAS